ncbi:ATPase [archaeon]|jgi:V/A-type H+-transporting ATPase subunit K|nr:ATPase [archaeon]MDP6547781.1 ATPase [Candidatus Woesearchaeota archaeon]MDP7263720.1 ATPase [Candidatus Woesearchaeota archaeon]HJN56490.1 ATPase [Candidatus Woesearchaeota archaeon]|tara:strand:- start:327 stop:554 length:228 start_codon:yes stop_codon:yes gene_type:complete
MVIEIGTGLIAVGAGLAIGLGAVGTGVAQQQAIAAVVGAIAEDPKMFGKGLFFIVLPETLVIFGLVIAIMLMGRM